MLKQSDLLSYTRQDQGPAWLAIQPVATSAYKVHPYLFAKFCEHLGHNIYHGMEAELLFNPTFGRWNFGTERGPLSLPDGGVVMESNPDGIAVHAERYPEWVGLHKASLLLRDFGDGLAFGWVRLGDADASVVSPDAGPHGNRAQRVETFGATPAAPQGIMQQLYLPLHRTRGFEFRLVGRALKPVALTLSLAPVAADGSVGAPLASAQVTLGPDWGTYTGRLDIPAVAKLDPAGKYLFSIAVTEDANLVLDRVMLYPDDHINHADPDVIRMLREAKLPMLRWPGGNFVSGYHWRDGVGPVDSRPTYPNPAWEGLEFNLFGTDEFMSYCQAVGCEPMICINTGNGTPEEGAAWVEYCNGSVNTPMGKLRAANGHPEPYGVRLWEIGNEIYGRWQVSWTTAGGYVDRYQRYVRAMQAVDPSILVLACGDQTGGLEMEWNRRLIDETAPLLNTITDHLLTGDTVGNDTDPATLFQGFMGYATTLPAKYGAMCDRMKAHGVADPHIAITELQLFAHFRGLRERRHALRPDHMPTSATISEALYLTTMINASIHTQGLVNMITHSATLNHGGGLRKAQERVWGTPVHYAHQMSVELAGGTPVKMSLTCPGYDTEKSFGQVPAHRDMPALEPMAVLSADGKALLITLMSRVAGGDPIQVEIDPGVPVAAQATVVSLSGDTMYDQNILEAPERIVPRSETVAVQGGKLKLAVPPYTLLRVTLPLA
jgi:alpha-N-arabinofuranosidase